VDRLFLDANILFSAAYNEGADCASLWTLPDVELLSSGYALEEARRNLAEQRDPEPRLARLAALVPRVRLVGEPDLAALPAGVTLREKDVPILTAAIAAGATHLITLDRRDFGPYMKKSIAGVMVLHPRSYIAYR
jgi:predicted nucleic acid-binding protein